MLVRNARFLFVLLLLSAQCALAYVDPGVTGMLFQMGYVAFYGALAVLAAFFRPIKMFVLTLKQKLFGGKAPVSALSETDVTPEAEVDVDDIGELDEVEEADAEDKVEENL